MVRTIIFTLTILFAACQVKQPNYRQVQKLLSSIDSVHAEIDKYGNPFDEYNQELTKIFTDSDRIPLGVQHVDSLAKLLEEYLNAINRGISKMQSLPELDSSYKIVSANLSYLNHQKKMWNKMGAQYLMLYKTGWYNLSEEQQNDFFRFIGEIKIDQTTFHQLQEDVNTVSKAFSRNYGIEYITGSER